MSKVGSWSRVSGRLEKWLQPLSYIFHAHDFFSLFLAQTHAFLFFSPLCVFLGSSTMEEESEEEDGEDDVYAYLLCAIA